ncbi:DUF2577 domain-containing protein [Cohnella abietis]|uniref:Phage protein n=1 Tax=Cohnella abietis TaxID=2507935 RepID=A0A3T1D1Q4_9BACL|nr:DUF2577 domain-containing protein [Cohnella abietis]BBI32052.1 phage protein [Cohnella abietis]
MSMLDIIKRAGAGAVSAGSPVSIITGSVMQADPLEVTVDQRFTLSADFLIVPESLVKYEVDIGLPNKLLIRRGLEKGDKLILLRVQGGQQYVILDRVI